MSARPQSKILCQTKVKTNEKPETGKLAYDDMVGFLVFTYLLFEDTESCSVAQAGTEM